MVTDYRSTWSPCPRRDDGAGTDRYPDQTQSDTAPHSHHRYSCPSLHSTDEHTEQIREGTNISCALSAKHILICKANL